jgi:1-acyl-sn-glycerol-3-phosphate acyltransferase
MIRSAFVALSMSLCILVLGPPLILLTLITKSATLMYWTGVKMVVYVTRIAGEKVTVEGVENIPPGVCLFAANHTSNADAPAIVGAIPRRIAILGRKSLFDIPVVGTAFRLAKFVPVDRGNRDAALESVKIAVRYIREGFSFLVYPEGTRSPDGRLQRFKKGSFAIAIEAGIPIVPVSCAGAHRIMKKNSWHVHPGNVTVRFGKPVDASKFTIEQRDELAIVVHEAIAAILPEDQKPKLQNS